MALVAGAEESGALVRRDDVVATLGGARMVALDQAGHAEALLAAANPDLRLRWRSLAWEGDTVFARPRDLNFPEITNQLRSAGATVVLLYFGEMESFAGAPGLPAFSAAYEGLLKEVGTVVARRVLVLPCPPPGGDLIGPRERGAQTAAYSAAIRDLGSRLGLPVVDLGDTGDPAKFSAVGSSPDIELASRLASGLSGAMPAVPAAPHGRFSMPQMEALRQAIVIRNRLWFDYARPMNWAFLAGDRTDQPSSRDHRDRSIRWFPAEMEQFLPLIAAADQEVWKAATTLPRPTQVP